MPCSCSSSAGGPAYGSTLYFPAGTSARFRFTARQFATGQPLDLTGGTLALYLKTAETVADANASLTATTGNGKLVVMDALLGLFDWVIAPGDTSPTAYTSGDPWFRYVKFTNADGEVYVLAGSAGDVVLDAVTPAVGNAGQQIAYAPTVTAEAIGPDSSPVPAYATIAYVDDLDAAQTTALAAHTARTDNPHAVTKTQVGLGNVDNTSDANKPISTATQTALDGKIDKGGNVFRAAAATWAAIHAAAQAAITAGGGVVEIPAGVITATSELGPLPVQSKLSYRGAGAGMQIPEGTIANPATVLVGDGTFDCFAYNATDNTDLTAAGQGGGSPLQYGSVGNSFEGIHVRSFRYGWKIGALNRTGGISTRIKNCAASQCTQWGVWLENCVFFDIESVFTSLNAGGQFALGSTVNNYNFGNGSIRMLGCAGYNSGTDADYTSESVKYFSGNGSSLNSVTTLVMNQSASSAAKATVTATTTNGSTNITVSSATKLKLGSPVVPTSSFAGLTSGVMYRVVYISGTTIRLANSTTDTPITASASTSGSLSFYGFPNIDIRGGSGVSPSERITGLQFWGMDLEGTGTAAISVENATAPSFERGYLTSRSGAGDVGLAYVARNSDGGYLYWPSNPGRVDLDNGSRHTTIEGAEPLSYPSGYTSQGIRFDDRGPITRFYMSAVANYGPLFHVTDDKRIWWDWPFQLASERVSAGVAINGDYTVHVNAAGANSTSSLYRPNAAHATEWNVFVNPTAYQWTISVTSGGTSFVIPPYSQRHAIAYYNGSAYDWSVTPMPARTGTVTLTAGAATVSDTLVTANSVISLTLKTASGARGFIDVVPTAGTGFVLTGAATDNGTYNYRIMEP